MGEIAPQLHRMTFKGFSLLKNIMVNDLKNIFNSILELEPVTSFQGGHLNTISSFFPDGGGMNGSHTNLLPGPIWNYNSVVEKPPGTNN